MIGPIIVVGNLAAGAMMFMLGFLWWGAILIFAAGVLAGMILSHYAATGEIDP